MSMSFTRALALVTTSLVLAACGANRTDNGPAGPGADELAGTAQSAGKGAAQRALPPAGPPPEVKSGNEKAFADAVTAIQSDRLRDAEILLLEITADQPELAGPWINLGQIYVALEQLEEARMAFQQAIRANPRSCPAYNELGVLSRRHGDFAGAEDFYRTCIDLVPEFKDAYLNLGILYELYLGRLNEALDYYRQYQSLLEEPDRRVQGWVMDLERRLGV